MTELLVIGCRAGSPGGESPASGYVLFAGGKTLLIDCGPGVVAGLAARDLIRQLDAVIVTHRHADHCADLVALAYHRLFPERMAPLPLYGPAELQGTLAALDRLFGIPSLPELAAPLVAALPLKPLSADATEEVAGMAVRTLSMVHPVATLALHFSDVGLSYTSDGTLTEALCRFVKGSSTLLAEATYLSSRGADLSSHGHMTAVQAGTLARCAGVRRLILTHLTDYAYADASREEAQRTFAGKVQVAAPGLRIALT